jgi:hypothetical protein
MDWSGILSIVMAVLVAIGLPLAIHSRKKHGPKKGEELYDHLREMGVKVSLMEKGNDGEKIGVKRSWGQKSEGTIEVKGRNLDTINIIGVSSQYGTHYFLDYLVRSPNLAMIEIKKTSMRKKKHFLWGKSLAVEWVGDKSLAQNLNLDYRLESKLMQSQFKGTIGIAPESKSEYARIRTSYFLPSPDLFEAIDIIAGHIRSG